MYVLYMVAVAEVQVVIETVWSYFFVWSIQQVCNALYTVCTITWVRRKFMFVCDIDALTWMPNA